MDAPRGGAPETRAASEADGDEGEPTKEKIEEVTRGIFEYYSIKAQRLHEARVSSGGFMRFALDANITDGNVTSARIDLIYTSISVGAPNIGFAQFQDALVRIAGAKFPGDDFAVGLMRLYREHLANFTGPSDERFSSISADTLHVLAAARQGLLTLFEGYFEAETSRQPRRSANEATKPVSQQSIFLQVMRDFDVEPKLVSKPIIFAVFREVTLVKQVPASFCQAIAGDGPLIGRKFTYAHFVAAIAFVAQRCFGEVRCLPIVRLLSWMDDSKGRSAFFSNHPGRLPAGKTHKTFTLLPENGAVDYEAKALTNSAVPETKHPSLPSSEVKKRNDFAGGSGLSASARRIIRQTFEHYSLLGGPLKNPGMSSMRFHRFLRDSGILSNEGEPVPASLPARDAFAPTSRVDGRRSSTPARAQGSSAAAQGPMRRSSSTGAIGGTPSPGSRGKRTRCSVRNASATPVRDSIAFTVSSPAKSPPLSSQRGTIGLPLQVLPGPVISTVDADLVFLQATRITKRPASSVAFGTTSIPLARKSEQSALDTPATRKALSIDDFCNALASVATRCMPECSTSAQALEDFSRRILEPLVEILVGDKAEDVVKPALTFIKTDETFLPSCSVGLKSLFQFFAADEAKSRWSKESFVRFLQEFGLTPEVGYTTMQNLFRSCAEHESAGRQSTELRYSGFQLLIVLVALQSTLGESTSTLLAVTQFLGRLNATILRGNLKVRLGVQGDMFPVRSMRNAVAPIVAEDAASSRGALLPASGERRRGSVDLPSWNDVMQKRETVLGSSLQCGAPATADTEDSLDFGDECF